MSRLTVGQAFWHHSSANQLRLISLPPATMGEDVTIYDKKERQSAYSSCGSALSFGRDMENSVLPEQDYSIAVSPAKAARLMGVGRTTLYELIADGSLRSSKFGSRRVITLKAIQECLDAHEDKS